MTTETNSVEYKNIVELAEALKSGKPLEFIEVNTDTLQELINGHVIAERERIIKLLKEEIIYYENLIELKTEARLVSVEYAKQKIESLLDVINLINEPDTSDDNE